MATYFEGAVKSGTSPSEYTNVGYAVFTQTKLIDFVAEAGGGNDNIDTTIVIPAGSAIISIFADTLTAWDSATSATLSIGTTAGGQEFMDNTDVKSNGRETTAPTAADLALWDDVGTSNTLNIRVAQVGNTTAGQLRVTVLYVPKS
jgi:hypothetical protein